MDITLQANDTRARMKAIERGSFLPRNKGIAERVASQASERLHLCFSSLQTRHNSETMDTTHSNGIQTRVDRGFKNLFALGELRVNKKCNNNAKTG